MEIVFLVHENEKKTPTIQIICSVFANILFYLLMKFDLRPTNFIISDIFNLTEFSTLSPLL